MDNKRIATGYDVEVQLKPERIKCLIDRIIEKELLSNQNIADKVSLDTTEGFYAPNTLCAVFEYPCTFQGELPGILKITLECDIVDGLCSIKPHVEAFPIDSDLDIMTMLGITIPSFPLPFSKVTAAEIIAVPASDNYTSAIALLLDLNFASLMDVEAGEIESRIKNHDVTKVLSFLPLDAEYAVGFNKSVYDSISECACVRAKKIIVNAIKAKDNKDFIENADDDINISKKILDALRIKTASTTASKDTLKITIKGKYDIPNTDGLDLLFQIKISIKFTIGEDGILRGQSTVKTNFDYNVWYSVLGFIVGSIVLGPIGGTVGLHTNSIIKRATRDMRNEISEKVNSIVHSSVDYHYCSDNGVGKLRLQKGFVNRLNCFLRNAITLIQQQQQSGCCDLYQIWLAVRLKVMSTSFGKEGASICGNYNVLDNYAVCSNVSLKRIKYYKNDQTPTLVYNNVNLDAPREINLDYALDTIKNTERADSSVIDADNDNCRSATGKLPMSILNFPIAVHKTNNELDAFRFDNGLIAKKEELIKLYKNGMILIKDVKLVGAEGKEYFISLRDKTSQNNLSSLPPIDKQEMDSIYYDD